MQPKVDWSNASHVPLEAVNGFAVSILGPVGPAQAPEGLSVVIAELPAPVLMGTDEENWAVISDPKFRIEANIRGRYFLSRERAGELLQILTTSIQQYDALAQQSREQNV
jgi:hypothetical protein